MTFSATPVAHVASSADAAPIAPPAAMLSLRPSHLGVVVAGAFAAAAWAIVGSIVDLLLFATLFAAFTLPGWPLARWLAGRRAGWLTLVPLALLLGYVAGFTLFLVARVAGLDNPVFALLLTIALGALLWLTLTPDDDGLLALPTLDRRDGLALAALLLVVAALVGPVFANVGRPTPGGLAYRAYFIADLFAHMSVVAELMKPTTPPVNPYFPGEALPYYWSFFTLPAIFDSLRDAMRGPIGVDRGILLTDLVMGGVYVSVWFLALRALGVSALASALAWATVLLASSFEALLFLVRQFARGRGLDAFRFVNIDAITRWIWDLPPVDGLHRLLWYTPQHGMAITLGLLAIVVGAVARRRDGVARGLVDGLLLGGALACSSFNGLLLVGGYALAETWRLMRDRFAGLGPWLIARAIAAIIVAGFLGLTIALGMIQRSSGELVLRWNPHFLRAPWTFIALSFGPALFLAPFGVRRLIGLSRAAAVSVAALSLVCAAAFLYVDVRGHDNTYVSFRTAQIWYLALAMTLAAAIDAARRWPALARRGLIAAGVLGAVAAAPTVALDWYNARDIGNVEMSVGGFPWTVHISPAHQAATAWIETHLRENDVVQTDASARGRATWALIPAFAERRLAVGLGLFEPNPRRFDADIDRVRQLYRTPDAALALQICEQLRIQYLYVGPEERDAHGPGADKFRLAPNDFTIIYDAAGVTIYRVRLSLKALRGNG
jgi:hypothetical protein